MDRNDLIAKIDDILARGRRKDHICVNLSNGAEILQYIGVDDVIFLNIQSTQLEQKNYDDVITRLGTDFILRCAFGHNMYVVDFGTKKDVSRAIYCGVNFAKYAMERAWFDKKPSKVFIKPRSDNARPINVVREFDHRYCNLKKSTKKYLRKFRDYANQCRPYAGDDEVHIFGLSTSTVHDGDKDYYLTHLKIYEDRCETNERANMILDEWRV